MVEGWKAKDKGQVWSAYIPLVQRIINGKKHTSTGEAPATLVYGSAASLSRGLTEPLGGRATIIPDSTYVKRLDLELSRLTKISVDFETEQRSRRSNPAEGKTCLSFQIGDKVLVKLPNGRPNKLADKWMGPRTVVAVQHNAYWIERIDGKKDLVNVDRLRSWAGEVNNEDIIEEAGKGINLVDRIVGHDWPSKYRKQHLHRYLGFQVRWKNAEEEAPTNQTHESLKHTDALEEYLGMNPELKEDIEKSILKATERANDGSKRNPGNSTGSGRKGKKRRR